MEEEEEEEEEEVLSEGEKERMRESFLTKHKLSVRKIWREMREENHEVIWNIFPL